MSTLRPDFAQAQNGYYIFANYFKVNLPETDLFQYSIRGMDMSYSRNKRELFFSRFIEECPLLARQQDDFATDGNSLIIARKYLDSRELGHESDEAVEGAVIASHQIPPPQRHKAEVELSPVYDGKIPLKTYKQYIQGDPASDSIFCNTTQVDRALNIIVVKATRKDAPEDFETFQRGDNKYCLKAGADDLGRGLVANRGYFSTIKPAMGNAIINVNTTMNTYFKPMLLSNFMEPFGAENRTKLERILKGLKRRIKTI